MIDWTQVINDTDKYLIAQQQKREVDRNEKQKLIDNIKVDVGGLVFDGDERSQARMVLVANAITDGDCVLWVLSNNETISVTGSQLREAARLSAIKMADIWTGDYI